MNYPIINLAQDSGHSLASGPFETQTQYTQIALAVRLPGMIADAVCPRVRAPYKFTYTKLMEQDQLTLPEDGGRASRAGRLREVEFGSEDENDIVQDYGLLTYVPDRDVREARSQGLPYDPIQNSTTSLRELQLLLREQRVAKLVFDESNYLAGYKKTLATSNQWSHANSSPIQAIIDAIEKPLVRPNTLVLGQQTWTKLRQHGDILNAVNKSGAGRDQESGLAGRRAVADLFELDDVLVGRVQTQTNNRGQTPSYDYLWGKHAALLAVNPNMLSMQTAMPTFCFTAEAMPVEMRSYMEGGRGVGAGSHVIKVSESCKEVVAWGAAGYFWKNAVA
ncbi:MAG: hypothetical protein OXH76_18695 [Boseongicola sp.]|nr:hypothetical protein [Boseongicola sp.]